MPIGISSNAPSANPADGARAGRARRSGRCSRRSSAAPTARRARPRTSAGRRPGWPRGPRARARRRRGAVVQPHRVPLDVRGRALLRGRQGAGQTLGLAAEQPLDPAAPLGGRGEVDVAADERDGEGQLLRPEARVERGEELADLLVDVDRLRPVGRGPTLPAARAWPGAPSGAGPRRARQRSRAGGSASPAGRLEQGGPAVEHGGGRRPHRAGRAVHRQRPRAGAPTGSRWRRARSARRPGAPPSGWRCSDRSGGTASRGTSGAAPSTARWPRSTVGWRSPSDGASGAAEESGDVGAQSGRERPAGDRGGARAAGRAPAPARAAEPRAAPRPRPAPSRPAGTGSRTPARSATPAG